MNNIEALKNTILALVIGFFIFGSLFILIVGGIVLGGGLGAIIGFISWIIIILFIIFKIE